MGILRTAAWMGACILAGAVIATVTSGSLLVDGTGNGTSMINSAWNGISKERLLDVIRTLSSDEYQGRAPATKGEELTTTFIENQFKEIGLGPGNPDGTYFQEVPMVGITADSDAELVFAALKSGQRQSLR